MNNWLPGNPSTAGSNFLRPNKINGEARIRVLELPFAHGYQRFTKENKPVMREPGEMFPEADWKDDAPKPFWACPVWNYTEKKVQVFAFTQVSIYKELKKYGEDSDWGAPDGYDLKIRRTGSGMETEYTVVPGNKAPISAEVVAAWTKVKEEWTGLSALWTSSDPFKPFSEEIPF